jgi:CHAT domain-containing protein
VQNAEAASAAQKWAELKNNLPPQVQVVQYAVLKDRLLIWVVSRQRFNYTEQPIGQDTLTKTVTDYLSLITQPNPDREALTSQSRALYESLIRPIDSWLDKTQAVCFVPDKVLSALPFPALLAPPNNQPLLTEFTIFSAPSVNTLVAVTAHARAKPAPEKETILSVGNPAFDRKLYPELPALPASAREATEITRFYSANVLLTGPQALKKTVLDNLSKADVVHLAGHHLTDEHSPANSKLLLATPASGADESQSALSAQEIAGQRLNRTQLLVLSACQTNTGRYYNGEGMVGTARAFLAAGVPVVVASQWLVDSEATAKLMIAFHRHRQQKKLSAPAALRQAQLEMLDGPDELHRQPYYWAAFLSLGGYAQ